VIEEISGDFLQWLRGFYFVVEKGSVRRAAIAMGREQPTISRQIKCLEKELGVTLFDRSSGKMIITPEGKILQAEAVSIFEDVKRVKGEFSNQELSYRGEIVIATTHVIIDAILPPYVQNFRKLHPGVTFRFEGGMREGIYEMIESAAADFGITTFDTFSHAIAFHYLYETELALITPKNSHFFRGKFPTLRQIAKGPLILIARGGVVEPMVGARFFKERLKPNVIITHNNFVSVKEYVHRGMGIAILSAHAITPEDEQRFDVYRMDRYFPKREYGILLKKKKYLSPLVKAFIRSIKPDIDFSAADAGREKKARIPSLDEFLKSNPDIKSANAD